jgi:hypothetical protein
MMLVRTNYSKPGIVLRTTYDQGSDLNLAVSNSTEINSASETGTICRRGAIIYKGAAVEAYCA